MQGETNWVNANRGVRGKPPTRHLAAIPHLAVRRQKGVAAGVVIAYAKICTQRACQYSFALR
eukprot:4674217-Lingulodinium_polyedra.AAC.1